MAEEESKAKITYGDMSHVVVANCKVIVPGMVVIKEGGREVGRLDGVFDFSTMPVEHHVTAANLLLQQRMSLNMPPSLWVVPRCQTSPPSAASRSTDSGRCGTMPSKSTGSWTWAAIRVLRRVLGSIWNWLWPFKN